MKLFPFLRTCLEHLDGLQDFVDSMGVHIDRFGSSGRSEISHPHHFSSNLMIGDGIEHHPLRHEFRTYIIVVQLLPNIKILFGKVWFAVSSSDADGGNMDELSLLGFGQFNYPLCAVDVRL